MGLIKMMDWVSLALVFVFGIAMGILASSFFFESKLKFYKNFIEQRLSSINRLRFQNAAKQKSSKPSHGKAARRHPSKREKDSKPSQK